MIKLIEAKMICENNGDNVLLDITNDIKPNVIENPLKDIGIEKKKWIKNCPKCGRVQSYKDKYFLNNAIKLNTNCIFCANKKIGLKIHNEYLLKPKIEWSKSCPKCGGKQIYTKKYILEISIKKNTLCNKCSSNDRKITIPENGWIKNCPNCNRPQKYSCKNSYTSALKLNKVCNECCGEKRKIIIPINGWHRTCKNCGIDLKYSCRRSFILCRKNNGLCRKCAALKISKTRDFSVFRTDEYREKQRQHTYRLIKNGIFNTEEFKRKQRENKLKQIEKLGTKISYNPNACKFVENYGKQHGYNFQHALNGGEYQIIGYSLDGYDKEKNVVFEYDESKHNRNYTKNRDLIRQNRIIEKLNPVEFLRFNEEYNKLIDVISGKEIV